jgi:hypothetical protein
MSEELPFDWAEHFKKVEPVLDRMVQAGWAKAYVYDQDAFTVAWTALGDRRMKYLSECFDELFPTPLTREHYAELWGIVIMYGAGGEKMPGR